MKAEQRKELETNTLADKMGRAMQRVKSSPRRTFMIYLVLTVAVLAGLFGTYSYLKERRRENADRWIKLYDGSQRDLDYLRARDANTYPGKAARFQVAWNFYWAGIREIGIFDEKDAARKAERIENFVQVQKIYEKLAEDCKGDKIFEPQALLGRAVCEETLAIEAPSHLEIANNYYEEVVSKYPDSAQAKYAQGRIDLYKDKTKRAELKQIYGELQRVLQIPEPRAAEMPDDIIHQKAKRDPEKK